MATTPTRARSLWVLLVAVLVSVTTASAWQQWRQHRAASALPVYGTLPAFALTDQHGSTVTLAALRGAPWVADFIFTRCGGQCPMMTGRMRTLQDRLPAGSRVRLVSVSVDPAHDTPQVLDRYAKDSGADSRWLFLTGTQEQIFRLSRAGFHLGAEPEGGSSAEPIIHSVRLVLVDGQGRIRGYYDGTEADAVNRLAHDLATLR